MSSERSVIVGIDLGTTNSLVAVCDERGPRVIADEQGRALLPSVVRLEPDASGAMSAVVGVDAKSERWRFPDRTFASVKRFMGRGVAEARADEPYLGFEVVAGENDTARFRVGDRLVSPQEISAHVLRELKQRAERALGCEVRKAVVTVPAYFDDSQRQATRDAGRLAGLDVVRIVNEPTAAALAYGLGLDRSVDRNRVPRVVAVFDLGGGTFDISILKITPASPDSGETSFFQVLATAGDTRLGGDDADRLLVDLLRREIDGVGPRGPLDPGLMQRLVTAAEACKRELSEKSEARVSVALDHGGSLERVVTREEFERLIEPWVERAIQCCRLALADSAGKISPGGSAASVGTAGAAARSDDPSFEIDAVVLVGGSTRVPLVRRRVGEFFGIEPYTALDPDQVVALGASVQASIISGTTKGSLLLDVIPLSLGIETVGGAVAKLIVRNSTVPTRAVETFSTSVDGQTSIKLNVLQGEREMAEDCRSLGVFHLRGIPAMPAGIPQVQVEFLIDANGVLNVSAVERRSGRRAAIQIIPNHGLTREEVDRMERESLTHAREDMTRHRVVDLVVNSRLDLKWIGEKFRALSVSLEPEYRALLESRLSELSAFIKDAERDWRSVDPNAFHDAKERLDRDSVRLQEIAIAASLRADLDRATGSR